MSIPVSSLNESRSWSSCAQFVILNIPFSGNCYDPQGKLLLGDDSAISTTQCLFRLLGLPTTTPMSLQHLRLDRGIGTRPGMSWDFDMAHMHSNRMRKREVGKVDIPQ